MKNVANARFTITAWDEKPYCEGPDLPEGSAVGHGMEHLLTLNYQLD
ncbi:MAG TPA: hypothetical protein VNX15_05545 [Gemmatimonadales bacterium]|jgi:hypothetical protein|nr:hypothetical protein [Gemmatimonadales bacterium]